MDKHLEDISDNSMLFSEVLCAFRDRLAQMTFLDKFELIKGSFTDPMHIDEGFDLVNELFTAF